MKEWKVEKNEFGKEYYELHFGEFYGDDEDIIAKFIEDETNDRFVYTNAFIYTSKELNADHDILFANSIEDAKQQIEEMLIEHWKDEIEYLEERLKEFQEKQTEE